MSLRSGVPIALLLLFAAPALAADVPEYSIEEFMATTTMRSAVFSADGEQVMVSSDESGVFNVVALPVDGGKPVALTAATDYPMWIQTSFPHDGRIIVSQDEGGNELNHLLVRNPDGSLHDLTPGTNLKAQWLGWTHDGTAFHVGTNERNPEHFDVYRYDSETLERERIYTNETGFGIEGVSQTGRWIALNRPITSSTSELHLWDRVSGSMHAVSPENPTGDFEALTFDPADQRLLFRRNDLGEFAQLYRYDLVDHKQTPVLTSKWDVSGASYSHDGSLLAVWFNEDAQTRLRLFDASNLEERDPELPPGSVSSPTFSRDGRYLAFYTTSGQSPHDLHVLGLESGDVRRLTSNLSSRIDPAHLVPGEVVRFASYDGVEIPGILYRPHGASEGNRVPALVWVHGGPGGQSRIGYSAQLQYLVNHGYAVYAINNRGSSGYGRTFHQMDDRRHGEADLGDVVASKQMLIDTGWVDPERIGIFGGSYGGYMVLAALTLRPTEFAVGVDLFGISNWVRTLESIPPYWASFRQALYQELGDPAEDQERLHRISPIFHADKIVRPLMVLQGANDPRVLQVESDEIVEAARANGVPVEYIVFEDEGHGFRNKDNRIRGYQAVLEFLDTHLAAKQPAG